MPIWLQKHDFEVFVAFLGLISGVPFVLHKVQAKSVEAVLPEPVVRTWGLVLVLGCAAILLGVFQSSRKAYPNRILWMRVEALGLTALAYYCYIYTCCIVAFNGFDAWPAAMIILAFGGTCHLREASVHQEIYEYRVDLGLQGRT